MAGDCEVNDPPAVVPVQDLKMSVPEIQKVQPKLKVKPKARETKVIPKAKENKEISKVKITKIIPKAKETKEIQWQKYYLSFFLSALTHITRIRRDFDAANSPRYRAGFAPMLFQWCYSHMARFSLRIRCDFFTARFFRSRPLFIARFLFCRAIFHVQTGWALLFVLQLIVLLVLLFVLQ